MLLYDVLDFHDNIGLLLFLPSGKSAVMVRRVDCAVPWYDFLVGPRNGQQFFVLVLRVAEFSIGSGNGGDLLPCFLDYL